MMRPLSAYFLTKYDGFPKEAALHDFNHFLIRSWNSCKSATLTLRKRSCLSEMILPTCETYLLNLMYWTWPFKETK